MFWAQDGSEWPARGRRHPRHQQPHEAILISVFVSYNSAMRLLRGLSLFHLQSYQITYFHTITLTKCGIIQLVLPSFQWTIGLGLGVARFQSTIIPNIPLSEWWCLTKSPTFTDHLPFYTYIITPERGKYERDPVKEMSTLANNYNLVSIWR